MSPAPAEFSCSQLGVPSWQLVRFRASSAPVPLPRAELLLVKSPRHHPCNRHGHWTFPQLSCEASLHLASNQARCGNIAIVLELEVSLVLDPLKCLHCTCNPLRCCTCSCGIRSMLVSSASGGFKLLSRRLPTARSFSSLLQLQNFGFLEVFAGKARARQQKGSPNE